MCQNLTNPLALGDMRTALSVALHEWVAEDVEPPASRFPTVAGGGLVASNALAFPDVPGVTYSGSYNPLRVADHRSLPPMQGDAYTVLVGRVDADGNMVDGVRHPNLAAPIGDAHRLEPAAGGLCGRGAVRRRRIVHSLCSHGDGAACVRRPASRRSRRATGTTAPTCRRSPRRRKRSCASACCCPSDADRIVALARRSGAATQQ